MTFSSFATMQTMVPITNIVQLQQNIHSCIELIIPRSKLDYCHHVFIGNVYKDGCDIYHYKSKISLSFISLFPAKITKIRLQYETYNTCSEILEIFNFNKGDTVEVVTRSDYPKPEEEEKRRECIKRAESRLGETQYTTSFNNCESYVNWIFSNDNSSKQASKSWKNYFLTLSFDELSPSNVLSVLLELVPAIFSELGRWIKEKSEEISVYLNLEKYWKIFVSKVDDISENILKQLRNPGSFQSNVRKAGQYLKDHPWIVITVISTIKKIIDIRNAEFLTNDQKGQNICRILGSFIGERIGGAIIPFLGIGGFIGNVVGSMAGDVVFFCTISVVIPYIRKCIS